MNIFCRSSVEPSGRASTSTAFEKQTSLLSLSKLLSGVIKMRKVKFSSATLTLLKLIVKHCESLKLIHINSTSLPMYIVNVCTILISLS